MLRLALAGRWLTKEAFADSYDRAAPHYDEAWLRHLRPVTDGLLSRLPSDAEGPILDLGCGTGYTTEVLSARFPGQRVVALDLSPQMLEVARRRLRAEAAQLVCGDMLEFLRTQPAASAGLVFSAWAIGYSHPPRLFGEAARVLKPNGVLAFVVNCTDTLRPVFDAFRKCMARFPDRVGRAAWLRFPRNTAAIEGALGRKGFEIGWRADGRQEICPPAQADGARLAWLLRTGVLAGFDAMLPLTQPGPVAEHFEQLLRETEEPIRHHYVAVIARRP